MAENKPSSLTLPLLVTKGLILFPGNTRLIDAGREFSLNAIKISKSKTDSLILVTSQTSENIENPAKEDLFSVGVLARIVSVTERENRMRARVEVIDRVALSNIYFDENEDKTFVAVGTILEAPIISEKDSASVVGTINQEIDKYPQVLSKLPKNIVNLLANPSAALELCYALAGFFDAPPG